MDYEIEGKSSDQAAKEFVQWVVKGYKSTQPNFLKFKADMRKTFNDPDMFNGELPTIKQRLTDTGWSK